MSAILRSIEEQIKANHRNENEAILAMRIGAFDKIEGPRVGDWLDFLDGTSARIAHHWGDAVQPASGNGDTGSFYLGSSFYLGGGLLSYSGGLEPGIRVERLTFVEKYRSGRLWFFDRDYHRAGGAVHFKAQFRVFNVA